MVNKCFKFYGIVQNHLDASSKRIEAKNTELKMKNNENEKCILRAPKKTQILFSVKNELRDQALSNVITTLKGKFFAYDKGYNYSKTPLKIQFRYLK